MKDLFLCHTGSDKPWAEALAERLERETINGRPVSVFLDKWDIDFGENVLDRIETGLRESRFLGVLLTPAFTKADWPKLEWQSQVHADPSGRLARILPLLLQKKDPATEEQIDIPLLLRSLRYFDFTRESAFEDTFAELVRRLRGERPGRGRTGTATVADMAASASRAMPDEHEEVVVSNLLAVNQYPTNLYSDETTATRKADVWKAYHGEVPPFALYNGRLYSFHPPDDQSSPFRQFLTGRSPKTERPLDWLANHDQARIIVGMCNAALKEHCYQLGIRAVREEWPPRFFCAIHKGSRTFRWSARARLRTLAKMATKPSGSSFGVHYAARMRFLTLGRDLFVLIEPGWLFTSDGITPLTGRLVTRLATQWGGKERNAAVLRNVLMWSVLLARGKPDIAIGLGGGQQILLKTIPAYTDVRVGLPHDAIRLEQMLSEGGGEVTEAGADQELDQLAALKMSGAIEEEEDDDDVEEVEVEPEAEVVDEADEEAPSSPSPKSSGRKRGRTT